MDDPPRHRLRALAFELAPLLLLAVVAGSCAKQEAPDAYGNFEAIEVIVASKVSGELLRFTAAEGMVLGAFQEVGLVDTTQLHLEHRRLVAARAGTRTQAGAADAQVQALEVRKRTAERDHGRAQKLLANSVLSQQEFDRVERDYLVVAAELEAARLDRRKIDDDIAQVNAQIARVEQQLRDCHVRAPAAGTVLVKYTEPGEYVQVGQPLFKQANLDTMELRAYFGEPQLAQLRIGSPASVSIDAADGTHHTFEGRISWISAEAEFTPTPIQTREERQDLVYAVKIRVPNPEGAIKIGMPADVQLSPPPP